MGSALLRKSSSQRALFIWPCCKWDMGGVIGGTIDESWGIIVVERFEVADDLAYWISRSTTFLSRYTKIKLHANGSRTAIHLTSQKKSYLREKISEDFLFNTRDQGNWDPGKWLKMLVWYISANKLRGNRDNHNSPIQRKLHTIHTSSFANLLEYNLGTSCLGWNTSPPLWSLHVSTPATKTTPRLCKSEATNYAFPILQYTIFINLKSPSNAD